MNYNKTILSKFDRIKHDYFDRKIYQLTLDYFLRPSLTGSTTNLTPFPDISKRQYRESPGDKPNCSTIHKGTVVRRDKDVVVARVNAVRVPSTIESPNMDMDLLVYKVTYPCTKTFIYPETNIGNGVSQYKGKRVINVTVHNPRQLRALAILSSGIDAIKRIDNDHYQVRSQKRDEYYDVIFKKARGWTCTCPNFAEYQQDCKHIYACHFSAKLRLQIEKEAKNDHIIESPDNLECPQCASTNVIKNGKKKCQKGIQQNYLCKDCKTQFVGDQTFSRFKATAEAIVISQDLFFKDVSLSKIQHHLKMFYKTDVHRSTILRWIQKFSQLLDEYADKHKPEVGDLWNSDEMTINVREKGKKGNYEWIWNVMDSDTRFLLASRITKKRYVKDARKALKESKERSGIAPKVLITDGQKAYIEATRKEFYTRKNGTVHFRTPAKREHFINQNIERLNGSVRERLKVMRGVNSQETGQVILDGQRFYYNHIRPHMSLNGMTPGQMAGLGHVPVEDNPWETYIRLADRDKKKIILDATENEN